MTRKQSRKPAKRRPILRSIVRIRALVSRAGSSQALRRGLDVVGTCLHGADLVERGRAQAEPGRIVADASRARALGVEPTQEGVLFVEGLMF